MMAERQCTVVGCERVVHSRGMCMTHYQAERRRQGGFRERVYDTSRRGSRKACVEADCGRLARARGLCMKHYVAARRAGTLGQYPVADH